MTAAAEVGRGRRLERLLAGPDRRAVIVPLDAILISNAIPQPLRTLRDIALGRPDAVLGFPGLFRAHGELFQAIPAILNLTASTERVQQTRKRLVAKVDLAVRLGVDAVAVHVNVGSDFEGEMLQVLGAVADRCDRRGLPLLAIMYPRNERENLDAPEVRRADPHRYASLVMHAARIGVELGADLIKTQYTGRVDSFREVVQACAPVPVLAAGGARMSEQDALRVAGEVIGAGGCGVCFGRNVFEHDAPRAMIRSLLTVVHREAPTLIAEPTSTMERSSEPVGA